MSNSVSSSDVDVVLVIESASVVFAFIRMSVGFVEFVAVVELDVGLIGFVGLIIVVVFFVGATTGGGSSPLTLKLMSSFPMFMTSKYQLSFSAISLSRGTLRSLMWLRSTRV